MTVSHVFLAPDHAGAERRTWAVMALCGGTMVLEIACGALFGSVALVADGLHMSTHAGAFLLSALAYSLARRHAHNPRFSFGTGKFGDLAGFTSAVVLALVCLLIAWEALEKLVWPSPARFGEALPIACLGLVVNLLSAWLLSGHHSHGHAHDHAGHDHGPHDHDAHEHGRAMHADNNMRSALVHVAADAAVSVLVIVALLLGRAFGWLWADPAAALVGTAVIASWAWTLVRDTGAILLDMIPDPAMAARVRDAVEAEGDRLADFHLWRVGPGHLAAIVCVCTDTDRDADFYRARLARFKGLSHVTVETRPA